MPGPGITKRLLADALKKHMAARPLSKISVGDIVDECGLNRNSFYYHFKDKYDLVHWIFYTEFVAELNQEEFKSTWKFVEQICYFFYRDKAFYSNALSETGQNSLSEYFSGVIQSAVFARMEKVQEDEEFKSFFATFLIDSLLACIIRWLREGTPIPPEQLAKLIQRTLSNAAVNLLEDTE